MDPPLAQTCFEQLSKVVRLDAVTSGRVGNHLTRPSEQGIPLVRTTTSYESPPLLFTQAHDEITHRIHKTIQSMGWSDLGEEQPNHALLEIYDQRYRKMGFHSDQALDLDPRSYIAIFSCYDRAPQRALRCLSVKSKETDERFSIELTPHSVVLFSVQTNARYLHKIHLPNGGDEDISWLGITFRRAKSFLRFDEGLPRFASGELLTLATEEQRSQLFKLRGQENRSTQCPYPELTYTVSAGDLLAPG